MYRHRIGKNGWHDDHYPLQALASYVHVGLPARTCYEPLQWTATIGDEERDSGFVLTRPGLRVIGIVSVETDSPRSSMDTNTQVMHWEISGNSALLPKKVRVDAMWRDLANAYGPLHALGLNGTIYVTACSVPWLLVRMDSPTPDTPINGAPGTFVDSVMSSIHIRDVVIRGSRTSSDGFHC